MPTDPNAIPNQYNALTGEELAKLVGNAVYNKLREDCQLNPGVTFKLLQLKFTFQLWWQNELGEQPNQLVVERTAIHDDGGEATPLPQFEGQLGVEVGPNVAPDDIRRRFGLEVLK